MSDSNQVSLTYVEETTWGVVPDTAAMKTLRFTGESLAFNITNKKSAEIRSDRQVSDLMQTGAENAGGFNFELSYETFDDMFEGALWSDWTSDLNVSAANEIAATTTGFTTSDTSNFTNIIAGSFIKIAGFTADIDNNGYFKVLTKAAGEITTSPAPGGIEAAAAGKTITIKGARLLNGSTRHSYSFERIHNDITSDKYAKFLGMVCSQANLSVQAESEITGSFQFMGSTHTFGATSIADSTSSAPTNDVINAVSNVASVRENNAAVSSALVKGIDISINNNVRARKAVGTLGAVGTGVGEFDVTGKMNVYLDDATLYNKYVNGTDTSIDFRLTDADGNTYIVCLPRIKFSTGSAPAGGANQDVMLDLGYQALRHKTYNYTIGIFKFAA